MKIESPALTLLALTCLSLASCTQRNQPPPQELVDAVAAEAMLMPKGHVTNLDGSEPGYFVIVRMLSPAKPEADKWASTNALKEWVGAPGHGTNESFHIAKLKERGFLEKASYRVRFMVDAWTESNAVASVELAYPERGGNTREWTFSNSTGHWVRSKDVSKGWWD